MEIKMRKLLFAILFALCLAPSSFAQFSGANLSVTFRETDQALPAGLFRFHLQGDVLDLTRNTAVAGNFSTEGVILRIATTNALSFPVNGAASAPPASLTGTWFSGGSATTTKPQLLIEPTGTTSTAWSTSGTGLGVNAASGFAGNLFDFQVSGSSRFSMTAAGATTIGADGSADQTLRINSSNPGYYVSVTSGSGVSTIQGVGGSTLIRLFGPGATAGFSIGSSVELFSSLVPAVNNSQTFGTSGKRASNVFSVLGDFSSTLTTALLASATNCADSAGDAACSAAPAGAVVVDATDTTTVVSTTAVTANSEIFVQIDAGLGTRLGVTCNTQAASVFNPRVTARTAATSFTITLDAGPTTNPLCLNYFIVN
jgi:hypothetical protein